MINGDWNPDAKQHDEWFPDHPLARLRREFANIQRSLRWRRKSSGATVWLAGKYFRNTGAVISDAALLAWAASAEFTQC